MKRTTVARLALAGLISLSTGIGTVVAVETEASDAASVAVDVPDIDDPLATASETEAADGEAADAEPASAKPWEAGPPDAEAPVTEVAEAQPFDAPPLDAQPVEAEPSEAQPTEPQPAPVQPAAVQSGPVQSPPARPAPAQATPIRPPDTRATVPPVPAAPPSDSEAARRIQSAAGTQVATRARLLVLEDGGGCAESRFVAYRRSDTERNLVDEWYVASQLWADATLLRAVTGQAVPNAGAPRVGAERLLAPRGWDEEEARCLVRKGFRFLDRLWADDEDGGYYPLANPTATQISRDTRYADDNALTGLALLAAAEAAPDADLRRRYLDAARQQAEFLTDSDLWDQTFGGGFWWSTEKGDTPEGKPAQTNAIAALFFARLHAVTGLREHRDWTLRTLGWMDATLYDPARKLYRWSVRYQDPARRIGGPVRSDRYFNYDQGIAIEAQLLASRIDGDQGRARRAREIGEAVHAQFWSEQGGGYNLQAGVQQVYTSYAAWTSLGHLALYDADGDRRWLEMAKANAAALTAALREADEGYALRHYRCVDRIAPGCATGQVRAVVDRTRDTAAQAWMQHLQTAIAQRTGR